MSIEINYKNSGSKKEFSNNVLFIEEKSNFSSLKKHLSRSEFLFIFDILKIKDAKKKILTFDISSKKK